MTIIPQHPSADLSWGPAAHRPRLGAWGTQGRSTVVGVVAGRRAGLGCGAAGRERREPLAVGQRRQCSLPPSSPSPPSLPSLSSPSLSFPLAAACSPSSSSSSPPPAGLIKPLEWAPPSRLVVISMISHTSMSIKVHRPEKLRATPFSRKRDDVWVVRVSTQERIIKVL